MKTKYIIILACSLLIYNWAFAQESLSLSDAIRISLEKNYSIRLSKLDLESADIQNTKGNAGMLPLISMGVNQTNNWQNGDADLNRSNSVTPSASLDWNLFSGFRAQIEKQRLGTNEEIAEINLQSQVESMLKQLVAAYYVVLLQDKKLKTNKELMDISEDRYKRVKMSNDIGGVGTYDVLQAQNDYLRDKADYLSQKTTYRNAIRNLNYIMGITTDETYTFTDDLKVPEDVYTADEVLDGMRTQNLNVLMMERNIKLAGIAQDAAKSSLYPSLSLNAGYNEYIAHSVLNPSGTMNTETGTTSLMLNLNYTLFNGFKNKTNRRIADIQQQQSLINQEDLMHALTNEALKQIETYNNNLELYQLSVEQKKVAELNLNLSREKYNNGSINSFNYRDVQNLYLQAVDNELLQIYGLITNELELKQLLGDLILSYLEEEK